MEDKDLKNILDDQNPNTLSPITTSEYIDIEEFIETFTPKPCSDIILNLNIQSLHSKYDNITILLNRLKSTTKLNIPFINLQETWMNEQQEPSIHFENYNIEYKHKPNNKIGGGLAILFKDNINYSLRTDLSFPPHKHTLYDSIFIETKMKNTTKLIIGNIYRSPGSTNITEFNNDLKNLLNKIKIENTKIIITGDFNINLLNINSHQQTADYLDLWISEGFIPQLTLPTRVTLKSATLIDNIFSKSNNNDLIISKGILTTDISDHYPSFIEIPFSVNKIQKKTTIIQRRHITENTLNTFLSDLNKETWQMVTSQNNTDDKFNNFISIYTNLMNKNLPLKLIKANKYKHKNNPWISRGIMNSIKSRDKLSTKINKERNASKKTHLIITLKKHKTILKKVIRKAKGNYWNQKFQESSQNIKETWKTIRSLINRNNNKLNTLEELKIHDKHITDTQEIANALNNHCVNISKQLIDTTSKRLNTAEYYLNKSNPVIDSIFLSPTNEIEILDITRGLKK